MTAEHMGQDHNLMHGIAPTRTDTPAPVTAGPFRYERTTLTDAAGNHPFAAWLRHDDRMPHIGPSIASDAEDALLDVLAAASPDSAPARRPYTRDKDAKYSEHVQTLATEADGDLHEFGCATTNENDPDACDCVLRWWLERASPDSAPARETAWLVEAGQSEGVDPPQWWIGGKYPRWTTRAVEAQRFPTRDAADEEIRQCSVNFHMRDVFGRATEHVFLASPDSAPAGLDARQEAALLLDLLNELHYRRGRFGRVTVDDIVIALEFVRDPSTAARLRATPASTTGPGAEG